MSGSVVVPKQLLREMQSHMVRTPDADAVSCKASEYVYAKDSPDPAGEAVACACHRVLHNCDKRKGCRLLARLAPEQPGEDANKDQRESAGREPASSANASELKTSDSHPPSREALADDLASTLDALSPLISRAIDILRAPAGVQAWAVVGPDGKPIVRTCATSEKDSWIAFSGYKYFAEFRENAIRDGHSCIPVLITAA
jgi:hypothetical protein